MRPPRPAYIVYLIGLLPVALFYERIRTVTGGEWIFLISGISYTLLLRAAGELLERRIRRRRELIDKQAPRSEA